MPAISAPDKKWTRDMDTGHGQVDMQKSPTTNYYYNSGINKNIMIENQQEKKMQNGSAIRVTGS